MLELPLRRLKRPRRSRAKVTGLTVNSAGSGSEYTHDSLDNRPPYYALAFIMKT